MTELPAMFWSGETLSERLKTLIAPFEPERIDCAAYTLAIGPEVYGAACKILIDSERRKNTQASNDVRARQLARF